MDATGRTRQVTLGIPAFPFPTIIFCPFLDLGASQLALVVKNLHANAGETGVQSLGWEDPLEEDMATHSSVFAWRVPMDRGGWWATVHRVVKSWTRLG